MARKHSVLIVLIFCMPNVFTQARRYCDVACSDLFDSASCLQRIQKVYSNPAQMAMVIDHTSGPGESPYLPNRNVAQTR